MAASALIYNFTILFLAFCTTVSAVKLVLFDSTKIKEDLNWSKISFKESVADENGPAWLKEKLSSLETDTNVYGWKESSFSMQAGGDSVWRIHFTCDLNEQNIQNWLFIPPINTRQANRLTLNLTFTIRECNKFPIKQVAKNCREKFELYYEEIEEANLEQEKANDNEFFLNKIQRLIFQDTFVSDTGLRYYNSVVDRKRNKEVTSTGTSSINIELREIPVSLPHNSYIRFAIRDTGACISLLSVQASYTTCSAFSKHGIRFAETSTGKDLTDLVQVSGECPLNSVSTQVPKAICTAKGEWLITDQNLQDRCQCMPGHEFVDNKCVACQMGYYKPTTSNHQRCSRCPANSWSFRSGQNTCKCQHHFYREHEADSSSDCSPTLPLTAANLHYKFTAPDRLNISLHRRHLTTRIHTTFLCDNDYCHHHTLNTSLDSLLLNTRLIKFAPHTQRFKFKAIQTVDDQFLADSTLEFSLSQAKHEKKAALFSQRSALRCQIFQNSFLDVRKPAALCANLSIDLKSELTRFHSHLNVFELNTAQLNILALFKDPHFVHLRTVDSQSLQGFVANNSALTLLVCNLVDVELVRLELNTVGKSLDVFTIDFSLVDHCPPVDAFLQLQDSSSQKSDHLLFTTRLQQKVSMLEAEKSASSPADTSLRVHVLLPIVLSFFIVTMLIFIALFFRRFHVTAGLKEKPSLSCNKHIRRFMPLYNRSSTAKSDSSQAKCMNCSSSSSSSHSCSSASPSTTCTTSQILEETSKHSYYIDPHNYEDPAVAIQEFAQEIAPLDIKIESVIGGGEFGDVCKGKLKSSESGVWLTVAIKTLKCGSSEKNRCDFLTEASIMAQFHHENIVCLEGVVTQTHPYMIITEFMENGSLDTFLRLNSWQLNISDLLRILRDIANGMKYLAGMNFVHRDLAARNILVNKELKCKVADFGLSREIENGNATEGVYWTKGGKIPVRWTAPEAISHTKFTCSSDVWSFGVVAWEVMSFGERPYWNWTNTDVIKAIEKGFRLDAPGICPQVIYDMMIQCWESERARRPKFKQIVNDLDILLKPNNEGLLEVKKNIKNVPFIDTNRPNFAQLTSVNEWLNSLELSQYVGLFHAKKYLNLSQVLSLDREDLRRLEIWNEKDLESLLESIKCIHFELNFQNGFLV